MKTFATFLLGCFVFVSSMVCDAELDVAYAQATPTMSFGSTIGELIVEKAIQLGFNPADPRIAATVAAVGSQALSYASAAASAAGEAVGAVSWASVAASAGIAALLVVPTPLGNDTVSQWQFNSNGTVTVSANPNASSSAPNFPALEPGQNYYCVSLGCGGSPAAAAQAEAQFLEASFPPGYSIQVQSCSNGNCSYEEFNDEGGVVSNSTWGYSQASSVWTGPACGSGLVVSGSCVPYLPPPIVPPPPPTTGSPGTAGSDTSAADAAQAMNPQVVAATADILWSDAAVLPGYAGLPYPVAAAISTADATAVQGTQGAAWPTVGTFVGGAGVTAGAGSGSTPFSTTVSSADNPASSVAAPTDPGTGAQVNLGPDPGIGDPTLEQTPTAAQILAPILGLLPDLRSFTMPSHTSTCPEPTFTAFGQDYTVTSLCDLSVQFQSEIYGCFVLAFSLAALFIVLTA